MVEKEIVELVAKSLAEFPDEVHVNAVEGEASAILELKVAKSDVGKVIGKGGKIAESLRQIVRAVSAKNGRSVRLDILG